MWGWIHQLWCHKILGSLRTGNQEETNEYAIPYGDWFEIESCPHYLAEIVIYAGILNAGGTRPVWQSVKNKLLNGESILDYHKEGLHSSYVLSRG